MDTDVALDLSDEIILISGGGGALGQTIVDTLRARGAHVESVDLETGVDAADPAVIDRVLDRLADQGRVPTIVMCHAGAVGTHPLADYPLDEFDALVRSNLRSAYVTARQAARRWMSGGMPGHLLFTTSWVAENPWPEIGPYIATKAAINALMRQFALELAPHGIRANAVAPGIVGAGMALHQWQTNDDYRRRAGSAIPLGSLQTTQSVADACLFLCSRMASYMTGSVLTVDGGASLRPMD